MDLGEYGEITTPVDDPCQFRPDWRSVVAGFLFSRGVRSKHDLDNLKNAGTIVDRGDAPAYKDDYDEDSPLKGRIAISPFFEDEDYRAFAGDVWIRSCIVFYNRESDGERLTANQKAMRLARRWYLDGSPTAIKLRLEPLLLTDVSLDTISLDLLGSLDLKPAIAFYEKMYFNCREEDGSVSRSQALLNAFAMPFGELKMFYRKHEPVDEDGEMVDKRPLATEADIWKAIAVNLGYDALMHKWAWQDKAHGLKDGSMATLLDTGWKVAMGRLISDLYAGIVSHEDASRLLSAFTSHAKYLSDSKRGGALNEDNDTTKALMAILYKTSPKMITIDVDDEAVARRNADIQSRIESQMAINGQAIEDKGKAVSDAVVGEQIARIVGGK